MITLLYKSHNKSYFYLITEDVLLLTVYRIQLKCCSSIQTVISLTHFEKLIINGRKNCPILPFFFFRTVFTFPAHNKRSAQTGLKHPLPSVGISMLGNRRASGALMPGYSRNPTTNSLLLHLILPLRFACPSPLPTWWKWHRG